MSKESGRQSPTNEGGPPQGVGSTDKEAHGKNLSGEEQRGKDSKEEPSSGGGVTSEAIKTAEKSAEAVADPVSANHNTSPSQ